MFPGRLINIDGGRETIYKKLRSKLKRTKQRLAIRNVMAEAAFRKELERKNKVLVNTIELSGTPEFAKCRDLITVCCHATYLGDGRQHPEESDWLRSH